MRVIVERQSVVADVLRGVARFLHGADRHGLDQVLFGFPLYVVEQGIDAF